MQKKRLSYNNIRDPETEQIDSMIHILSIISVNAATRAIKRCYEDAWKTKNAFQVENCENKQWKEVKFKDFLKSSKKLCSTRRQHCYIEKWSFRSSNWL